MALTDQQKTRYKRLRRRKKAGKLTEGQAGRYDKLRQKKLAPVATSNGPGGAGTGDAGQGQSGPGQGYLNKLAAAGYKVNKNGKIVGGEAGLMRDPQVAKLMQRGWNKWGLTNNAYDPTQMYYTGQMSDPGWTGKMPQYVSLSSGAPNTGNFGGSWDDIEAWRQKANWQAPEGYRGDEFAQGAFSNNANPGMRPAGGNAPQSAPAPAPAPEVPMPGLEGLLTGLTSPNQDNPWLNFSNQNYQNLMQLLQGTWQ